MNDSNVRGLLATKTSTVYGTNNKTINGCNNSDSDSIRSRFPSLITEQDNIDDHDLDKDDDNHIDNLEREDDNSPQYDEGEAKSLESSIAKLRNLLEEKEKSDSVSLDHSQSDLFDSDDDRTVNHPKTNGLSSPEGLKKTAASNGDQQSVPSDGRLFSTVAISSAEVQEGNPTQFVLYCIEARRAFSH